MSNGEREREREGGVVGGRTSGASDSENSAARETSGSRSEPYRNSRLSILKSSAITVKHGHCARLLAESTQDRHRGT